jgi:hypothetical protein
MAGVKDFPALPDLPYEKKPPLKQPGCGKKARYAQSGTSCIPAPGVSARRREMVPGLNFLRFAVRTPL